MSQPTFNFVEHYLEFIGGFRDHTGKKFILFETVPPPISLARYDVKIINSLSVQTAEMGRPYTDKQAELAVKLVEKYKRQLLNLQPSIILPDKLDQFELGIRNVDRSKTVYIHNNRIQVRFPYDTTLIQLVRKLITDGHGTVTFNGDSKIWDLAYTEYFVNWVMAVLPKYNFQISEELYQVYEKILAVEKQNSQIVLQQYDDHLKLENANKNLLLYIEKNIGNINLSNLMRLVDYSGVLGYEVDMQLLKKVQEQFPEYFDLIVNRQYTMKWQDKCLDKIVQYAKLTNRLPVYFYDTGTPKSNTDEIVYINKRSPDNLEPKLLVTRTMMMIGAKKQSWITSAEKIIVLE